MDSDGCMQQLGLLPPQGDVPPLGFGTKRPSKDRQRLLRDDWILMRVASVVLVLAAAAFMVIIFVIIATHI
jgi:hypothetical protein